MSRFADEMDKLERERLRLARSVGTYKDSAIEDGVHAYGGVVGSATGRAIMAHRAREGVLAYTLDGIDVVEHTVTAEVTGTASKWELVGVGGEAPIRATSPGASREALHLIRGALSAFYSNVPGTGVRVRLHPSVAKYTSSLDLPIALAVAAALDNASAKRISKIAAFGELGHDGSVRPARGAFIAGRAAAKSRVLLLAGPADASAALAAGANVGAVQNLSGALATMGGMKPEAAYPLPTASAWGAGDVDIPSIQHALGAAVRAVKARKPVMLLGPLGSGRTMLARRIPGQLPKLSKQATNEVAAVQSAAGLLTAFPPSIPFHAPHHTISTVGLVGGGQPPRPGELSLAHGGVLFLDELPEFRRDALEAVQRAWKDGQVRPASGVVLPARFALVAAMSPCPCGYHGTAVRKCECTPAAIDRYRSRVDWFLHNAVVIEMPAQPRKG